MTQVKRGTCVVGLLCLASTTLGTSSFVLQGVQGATADHASPRSPAVQKAAQDTKPVVNLMKPRVETRGEALTGDIFRMALDPRESLFLSIRGDDGEIRYGIGAWAQVIQQWRSEDLFADSKHAWAVFPKTPSEPNAAGNKGADLERRLVPVDWCDERFRWQSNDLPAFRWHSGTVMRVRSEPASDGETISQVETAWFTPRGTQVEVVYIRGQESRQSALALHAPFLNFRNNTWIVVRFKPRAPATEEFVIIGVLSGEFVSRWDNTIRLRARTAACLQVDTRARQVKVIQRATLDEREGYILLRWQLFEAACDPTEVWTYQTDTPHSGERLEDLTSVVRGSYPLSPYSMWATQQGILDF